MIFFLELEEESLQIQFHKTKHLKQKLKPMVCLKQLGHLKMSDFISLINGEFSKHISVIDRGLSYGDGLSDVNIKKLIKFHLKNKKIATLTAVKYKNPKGILIFGNQIKIKKIKEKPLEYINGGFFVLSKKIFKFLKNSKTIFEKDCLPKLAKRKELIAFKHNGFWACMDTLREKKELNKIYNSKQKAWKIWV